MCLELVSKASFAPVLCASIPRPRLRVLHRPPEDLVVVVEVLEPVEPEDTPQGAVVAVPPAVNNAPHTTADASDFDVSRCP